MPRRYLSATAARESRQGIIHRDHHGGSKDTRREHLVRVLRRVLLERDAQLLRDASVRMRLAARRLRQGQQEFARVLPA